MKAALTIWNHRISPVFDVAGHVLVIDSDQHGNIIQQVQHALPEASAHDKLALLSELGVDELVCGAISRPVLAAAHRNGLVVYPFRSGEVTTLIEAWRQGNLEQVCYAMPGCGRNRHGKGQGRGRRCRCQERDYHACSAKNRQE